MSYATRDSVYTAEHYAAGLMASSRSAVCFTELPHLTELVGNFVFLCVIFPPFFVFSIISLRSYTVQDQKSYLRERESR